LARAAPIGGFQTSDERLTSNAAVAMMTKVARAIQGEVRRQMAISRSASAVD
jgi:hypothetical protein